MNRDEIVVAYLTRLDRGERIKLSTRERNFLVQDFIQQLQSLQSAEAIEHLCQTEIELLERGYGKGTNSTVNYLSKYRTAIAQATEQGKLPMTDNTSFMFRGRKRTGEPLAALQHLAYDLMRYENEVYTLNRKATQVGNNIRQDAPQPFNPDRYLQKASELLQSQSPESLAVGIAAVTGRRHTEVVVSGRFSMTQHPYLLQFEGQLKKADPVAYSILTLIPAAQVKEAIDHFRRFPQVQALAGLTSTDREVAAFRARVNTRVRHHFQDTHILPLLPGFQSVSVHRLRAAYARVAIHYWLPGQGVNEQRWLQFYLGHVTPGDMRDAANSNSTSHYFGYCLVDDIGKPITVTGIKLMANPLPSPTEQQLQQQRAANDRLDSDTTETDSTPQEEAAMSPTQSALSAIATDLQTLPNKDNQQSSTTDQPPNSAPAVASSPKRPRPRYRALRVNLGDLSAAANRLGIHASSKSGYQSLLDRVLLAIPNTPTEQATPDPNQLLAPLLQELAAIKQQVSAAQAGEALEQLTQLTQQQQQEIDRLRAELQAANKRLKFIVETAQGITSTRPVSTPQLAQPQQHISQSLATPAPTPQPTPVSRPQSGKLSPADRVPLAIVALMDYNQNCPPANRWYLSGNIIATTAGANPALVVTPWLQAHPIATTQIEQHNTAIGLNQRSNGKDKDRSQLKTILPQFIQGKSPHELQQIINQFEPQSD